MFAQVSPHRNELSGESRCLIRQKEESGNAGRNMRFRKRSRIVLGLGTTPFARTVAEKFHAMGWEVSTSNSSEEARRNVVRDGATAVVLPFSSQDRLSTAKIITSVPGESQVILVSPREDRIAIRFASMLGAKIAAETSGVAGIVSAAVNAKLLHV